MLLAMAIGLEQCNTSMFNMTIQSNAGLRPQKQQLLDEAKRRYMSLGLRKVGYRPVKPTTGWSVQQLTKWLKEHPLKDEEEVAFVLSTLEESQHGKLCIIDTQTIISGGSSTLYSKSSAGFDDKSLSTISPIVVESNQAGMSLAMMQQQQPQGAMNFNLQAQQQEQQGVSQMAFGQFSRAPIVSTRTAGTVVSYTSNQSEETLPIRNVQRPASTDDEEQGRMGRRQVSSVYPPSEPPPSPILETPMMQQQHDQPQPQQQQHLLGQLSEQQQQQMQQYEQHMQEMAERQQLEELEQQALLHHGGETVDDSETIATPSLPGMTGEESLPAGSLGDSLEMDMSVQETIGTIGTIQSAMEQVSISSQLLHSPQSSRSKLPADDASGSLMQMSVMTGSSFRSGGSLSQGLTNMTGGSFRSLTSSIQDGKSRLGSIQEGKSGGRPPPTPSFDSVSGSSTDGAESASMSSSSHHHSSHHQSANSAHHKHLLDAWGARGVYTGETSGRSFSMKRIKFNRMPSGSGRMHYDDGRTYEGLWLQGHWHGLGKLVLTNSAFYHGTFLHGVFDGQGQLCLPDGAIYDGSWKRMSSDESNTDPDMYLFNGVHRDSARSSAPQKVSGSLHIQRVCLVSILGDNIRRRPSSKTKHKL